MLANPAEALVAQKLQAFGRLEASFEASFPFAQDMQGQRRSSGIPVRHVVCYLHALYVCAAKDRLLGIPRLADRYEGEECLRAMRELQDGCTASTIALLERKLDGTSLADLTRALEPAPEGATPHELALRARQLHRGRQAVLNRLANRLQALDTLCGLSAEDLMRQVRQACAHYGHTKRQIERQLQELTTPLYQTLVHPALARRNIQVMERVGVKVVPEHAPEQAQLMPPEPAPAHHAMPAAPFAEEVIQPYYELTPPWHNNPANSRLLDTPEILVPPPEHGTLEQAQP